MQNNAIYRLLLLATVLLSMVGCVEDEDTPTYKDNYSTLYSFLEDNVEYSSFKAIVDTASIARTDKSTGPDLTMESVYSSYNSNEGGNRYTLFLPTNEAINAYLTSENLTFDQLLGSSEDCWSIATHHLINTRVYSSDFPNGEMSDTSLNGASHIVRYMTTDLGVSYLIDELASVVYADLYQSNGVIHVIDHVLEPLKYTSCEWLEAEGGYDIFVAALRLTGLYSELQDVDVKYYPFTMFVESDSVLMNEGITNLDDYIAYVGPDDTNYTDGSNLFYQFMAYHALNSKALYVTDMADGTSNYDTFTSYPISITLNNGLSYSSGLSEGIGINVGYENNDTIINGEEDTTFIDYVSIYESQSNTPTLSGVLHFVNYALAMDTSVSPATKTFNFLEDPAISSASSGEANLRYYFEDDDLERFDFGSDLTLLTYYRSDDSGEKASHKDYITCSGNYELSYRTTKLVMGDYNLRLKLDVLKSSGLIDVYLDGKKVGATVNVNSLEAPNTSTTYSAFTVGKVSIEGYEEHVVTIKSITPGVLVCDFIQFAP